MRTVWILAGVVTVGVATWLIVRSPGSESRGETPVASVEQPAATPQAGFRPYWYPAEPAAAARPELPAQGDPAVPQARPSPLRERPGVGPVTEAEIERAVKERYPDGSATREARAAVAAELAEARKPKTPPVPGSNLMRENYTRTKCTAPDAEATFAKMPPAEQQRWKQACAKYTGGQAARAPEKLPSRL